MNTYSVQASYREESVSSVDLQYWERDRIKETARGIVTRRRGPGRILSFSSSTPIPALASCPARMMLAQMASNSRSVMFQTSGWYGDREAVWKSRRNHGLIRVSHRPVF